MNETTVCLLLYLLSVLISVASQLLLKLSARREYSSHLREYLNAYVIVAYGFFFLATILTMLALAHIPLSVSPVIESLSYILVPLLSWLVLREPVTRRQFVGMLVILAGVVLFNLQL